MRHTLSLARLAPPRGTTKKDIATPSLHAGTLTTRRGARHATTMHARAPVFPLGVLERAPPELCADIVDKGIVLTGGGSKLRNLDKLLSDETGLPVFLCDEPEFAVVLGSGAALDEINILKEVALD